jgi:CheY-like chemotaxis protein
VTCDGFDPRDEGPEAEGSAPSPAGVARRVLVVDDNRDAADVLAEVVRLLGHVADVTYDGSSAVERARRVTYDVVLCDIGLPGMSGYEVAAALREEGTRARLVAVSAYDQRDVIARARAAGFQAYLVKPPDLDLIERLLTDG